MRQPAIDSAMTSWCMQVRPLRRQLKGLKAWITGQRKDQSPGTRSAVPVVQVGASSLDLLPGLQCPHETGKLVTACGTCTWHG